MIKGLQSPATDGTLDLRGNGAVAEVVGIGDFEGVASFGIGLRANATCPTVSGVGTQSLTIDF